MSKICEAIGKFFLVSAAVVAVSIGGGAVIEDLRQNVRVSYGTEPLMQVTKNDAGEVHIAQREVPKQRKSNDEIGDLIASGE